MRIQTISAGLVVALLAAGCDAVPNLLPVPGDRLCGPPPPPPTYEIGPPTTLGDLVHPDSLRVSADGSQLAALHGTQVAVWNTSDGTLTELIGTQEAPAKRMVLDATDDFSRFALAQGVTVVLMDASGGVSELGSELDLKQHRVRDVAFSPDGSTLAALTWGGNVELFSVADGSSTAILPACAESSRVVRFSPDGQLIAVGSFEGPVQVWDVAEGKEVATLGGPEHGSPSVAWSHDGTRLAVAATAWNTDAEWHAAIYDTNTWELVQEEERISPTTVAFSPDDTTLVISDGSTFLRTWDFGTGFSEYHQDNTVSGLTVGPDGRVYLGNDSAVTAFEPTSGDTVSFELPEWDCTNVANPGFYPECR